MAVALAVTRTSPGQFAKRAVGKIYREDGYTFKSFAEGRRYQELKLALKAGAIEWLKVHPRYSLDVAGVHVCDVELDFEYVDRATGKKVVEDVKGWTTSAAIAVRSGKVRRIRQVNVDYKLAQLKFRLLEALYGLKVVVIEKS